MVFWANQGLLTSKKARADLEARRLNNQEDYQEVHVQRLNNQEQNVQEEHVQRWVSNHAFVSCLS